MSIIVNDGDRSVSYFIRHYAKTNKYSVGVQYYCREEEAIMIEFAPDFFTIEACLKAIDHHKELMNCEMIDNEIELVAYDVGGWLYASAVYIKDYDADTITKEFDKIFDTKTNDNVVNFTQWKSKT